VLDDVGAMARINRGDASAQDRERLAREGRWLDGAFYLGSHALYDWLRDMPADQARGIGMTRVSHINQLYGGNEALEREQRRDARFFNTCMMMTALGAVVSDALEDGRVVSGVGGQYNFVAMAHALDDARSVLMLRASRGKGRSATANVRWNYGHATIPRHLRDIAITEHGIADLRGRSDRDCLVAMAAIAHAHDQAPLLQAARDALKLEKGFDPPSQWQGNTHEALSARLAPLRRAGVLPDYPMGSDFSPEEQRLAAALSWLSARTGSLGARLATVGSALLGEQSRDKAALARMGLQAPKGLGERLEARLLRYALANTEVHPATAAQD
jgi:acyl-CoA hydrolase